MAKLTYIKWLEEDTPTELGKESNTFTHKGSVSGRLPLFKKLKFTPGEWLLTGCQDAESNLRSAPQVSA